MLLCGLQGAMQCEIRHGLEEPREAKGIQLQCDKITAKSQWQESPDTTPPPPPSGHRKNSSVEAPASLGLLLWSQLHPRHCVNQRQQWRQWNRIEMINIYLKITSKWDLTEMIRFCWLLSVVTSWNAKPVRQLYFWSSMYCITGNKLQGSCRSEIFSVTRFSWAECLYSCPPLFLKTNSRLAEQLIQWSLVVSCHLSL